MKKKLLIALALVACVAAIIVGSVAGTLAYLRASVSVTNTFSYGKVAINLTEALTNEDGTYIKDVNNRGYGNKYMLMPGKSYHKDPVIHVGEESQAMYLFLKVDNGIAGLALTPEDLAKLDEENKNNKEYKLPRTIHQQLLDAGWKIYSDESGKEYTNSSTTTVGGANLLTTSTVYYLSVGTGTSEEDSKPKFVCGTKVAASNGVVQAENIDTFKIFTVSPSNATEDTMTAYVTNNSKIIVTAFAIQNTGEGINTIHDAADVFSEEFASAIPTAAAPQG